MVIGAMRKWWLLAVVILGGGVAAGSIPESGRRGVIVIRNGTSEAAWVQVAHPECMTMVLVAPGGRYTMKGLREMQTAVCVDSNHDGELHLIEYLAGPAGPWGPERKWKRRMEWTYTGQAEQ